MKKKMLVKFIAGLSIVSIALTGFPLNLLIDNLDGSQVLAAENTLELSDISDDIVIPEVDNERLNKLEETIEEGDYDNIQDLNQEELTNFIEAVDVEVALADLPTEEDAEAYKQGLLDLFDPKSDVYNNVEGATEQIIEEIDSNHSSVFDKIDGEDALAARARYRIRISTKVVAAGINLLVSLICGGIGSGAVRAVIRKFGTKRAIDLINRRIVGKLTVWGIKQFVGINFITQLVSTTIRNVLDPGSYIAKRIDAIDRCGTTGYIEY
ncbi:TPA: hypothetical protein ACJHMO_003582 [Enterococcus faecalis]